MSALNTSGIQFSWKISHRLNGLTVRAVTRGIGSRVIQRWWKVFDFDDRARSQVFYLLSDKNRIAIHGFYGMPQVFSLISEENNRVVARFYRNPQDAKDGTGLLKQVVLSEKTGKNRLGNATWQVLQKPKVEIASTDAPMQHRRVQAAAIKDFLLSDRPEGDFIDIEDRKASKTGAVHFGLRTADCPDGNIIMIGGYSDFRMKKLSARIVAENGHKKVYLWPNEKEKTRGAKPIKPEGHIIAKKNGHNSGADHPWQIIWRTSTKAWRELLATHESFKAFLIRNVHDEVFADTWSVMFDDSNGYSRARAIRVICGNRVQFPVTFDAVEVFAVTREIEGVIKLTEFWPSQNDYESRRRPFHARILAYRAARGGWQIWNAALTETEKFKKLIRSGELGLNNLEWAMMNDYMEKHYNKESCAIIDAFIN